MGGAQKSMFHPYDNLDLSFCEWFDIAGDLFFGGTYDEKIDVSNVTWRFDTKAKKIRIARNWTHIRTGAPTLDEFEISMQDHPGKAQFIAAVNALRKLEPILSFFDLSHPENKVWWFNMEYVSPIDPQAIKYDHETLVIHNTTTLVEDPKPHMQVIEVMDLDGFTGLLQHTGLNILHRSFVTLTPSTGSYYFDWISKMQDVISQHNLGLKDTLREYIYRCVVKEANIPWRKACMLADNVTGLAKHKIADIRKGQSETEVEQINALGLSKHRLKVINRYMKPIKAFWDEFGARRLEDQCSNLIDNKDQCSDRLHRQMDWNITMLSKKYIEEHRNLYDIMLVELKRFAVLNTDAQCIEGVVINYDGLKYKLTGAFPSMNRVCGAARYPLGILFPEDWEYDGSFLGVAHN